jgi:thiol-disulfide isomerase/thioredoxin
MDMIHLKRYGLLGLVLVLITSAIWVLESRSTRGAPTPGIAVSATSSPEIAAKAALYPQAHDFANPSGFINSAPFSIKDLIGKKVILIDFWTYSCINCQRTLPYLTAWDQKYKDAGLEIIGVHSPEFGFEKVLANVQAAVTKAGIHYPVVLDNEMGTWNAYQNLYWPHEYLIDIDGFVVEDHVGEGGYADTEAEIQKLLAERAKWLSDSVSIPTGTVTPAAAETLGDIGSPEMYFGAMRNEYFGNGDQGVTGTHSYAVPKSLTLNDFYLGGTWDIEHEYAENAAPGASITLRYQSGKVFFVAAASQGADAQVFIDGKLISAAQAGADVKDGIVHVSENRLYRLVEHSAPGEHTLELKIMGTGLLDAFTFTFG